jgi:phage terminase Nu1 subunit (DNA packaging protein)
MVAKKITRKTANENSPKKPKRPNRPDAVFRDEGLLNAVYQKVVARVLGISGTTIQKHKTIFIPLKGPRGRYNLPESVQNYVAFVRGEDRAGAVQGERGRLYEAQRAKLELQNRETAGELVRYSDASALISEFASGIRAGCTALPGRCASQLAGISKPAECRAILNAEVESLLSSVEQIVANRLAVLGEGRENNGDGGDDFETDAGPDAGRMGGREPNPSNRQR